EAEPDRVLAPAEQSPGKLRARDADERLGPGLVEAALQVSEADAGVDADHDRAGLEDAEDDREEVEAPRREERHARAAAEAGAGLEDAEDDREEVEARRQEERHARSAPDAEAREAERDLVRGAVELPAGQGAV